MTETESFDIFEEKLKNALQFLARYEARREQKQQHDVDLQSRPRKHLN